MSRKKTHEEFLEEKTSKEILSHIEVIGKYEASNRKIHCFCKTHNKDFYPTPSSLLIGIGCKQCAADLNKMKYTWTHERFLAEFYKNNCDNIEILSTYINMTTKIKCLCKDCGFKWIKSANKLMAQPFCPNCNKKEKREKSNIEFYNSLVEKVKISNPNITILGEYTGTQNKILVMCNLDGYTWETYVYSLLDYKKLCPLCNNRTVITGINDIKTTHPFLDNWIVDKEILTTKSYGVYERTIAKCPDCGHEFSVVISQVCKYGISCKICSDNISFPERVMASLLDYLNVNFCSQKTFSWSNCKRYDFYIEEESIIIETHGEQHYKYSLYHKLRDRVLEDEQNNDKYKKDIAIENGIKNYIVIDCRYDIEYIKNSILNSELSKIYNLDDVDWNTIIRKSLKRKVKESCDLWNKNMKMKDIAIKLNLNYATIGRYLKIGSTIGWC